MSLMSYDHLLTLILINLLLPTSSCLQNFQLSSPQRMGMEEKMRLGSRPPDCHNRCNQCDPCTPVQVPTGPTRSDPTRLPGRPPVDNHSNYKPLGWKCRCGVRFYNP